MWVSLEDGRILGVPLGWFPRLAKATPEQLAEVQISAFGLHWDALDEDVSVPALLEGRAAVEAAA
jgi:hypothetical protein